MQLPDKYKFAWTFRVSDAEDPPIRARVSVRAAGGSPPSPRAMFSDKEPVDERIDEVEAARYRRAVEILQKATRSRKLRALWPNMEKLRSMYIDPSAAAAGAASHGSADSTMARRGGEAGPSDSDDESITSPENAEEVSNFR